MGLTDESGHHSERGKMISLTRAFGTCRVERRPSIQWHSARLSFSSMLGSILCAGLVALSPNTAAAQAVARATDEVRIGDRWTYDSKDEITGLPTETFTHTVTEISPNEVVVVGTTRGRNGSTILIYDHEWSRLSTSTFKYKPNDGKGIHLPLKVGQESRSNYETRNIQTGGAWKDSIKSKVAAQETITTPAGTFETFRIETQMHEISATDPSRSWEFQVTRWYAPQVNRWVRWTSTTKTQGRTTASRSEELVEYARKE